MKRRPRLLGRHHVADEQTRCVRCTTGPTPTHQAGCDALPRNIIDGRALHGIQIARGGVPKLSRSWGPLRDDLARQGTPEALAAPASSVNVFMPTMSPSTYQELPAAVPG